MNSSVSAAETSLRRRLSLLRVALMFLRAAPILWGVCVWLVLLGGLDRGGWIPSTTRMFLSGAGGLVALAALFWFLPWIMVSRQQLLDRLVAQDDQWEPLRAYFFRPSNRDYHPYFEDGLRHQLKQLSSKSLFSSLRQGQRLHLTTLALMLFAIAPILIQFQTPVNSGPPAVPQIHLTSQIVQTGDTVGITSTFSGSTGAPSVVLYPGEKTVFQRTMSAKGEAWQWESHPLSRSLRGEVRYPQGPSKPFRVDVVSPPRINAVISRVRPPEYTGLPAVDDPTDPINLLPGSQVTLDIRGNRPFELLHLRNREHEPIREKRQASRLTHVVSVNNPMAFIVSGRDTYGYVADTVSLEIDLKQDFAPRLQLLAPDTAASVEGGGLLPVRVRFRDDFGLSRAQLEYGLSGAEPVVDTVPVPTSQSEGELYGQIDRNALGLMTGDTFSFRITAWDNDRVRGPKPHTIGPFVLSVYTWEQLMKKRDRDYTQGRDRLSQMSETVDRVRKELEEMARNRSSQSWEVSRKLQQAQQTLDRQKKQLDRARKAVQNRQERPGLSRESLKRLQDIREMMQEHAAESLKQARKSLNEAVRKQAEQQQLSAKDLQYSEEELQKFERDIERMHSLMENVRPMLEMDEMASTLESMAEEQQQWAESDTWSETARRQLERQQQQWDWMEKRLDELSESSSGETRKALESLREQLKGSSMAERARQLSRQGSPDSKEAGEYREKTKSMRNRMRQSFQQQAAGMQQKKQSLRSRLINHWTSWFQQLQHWEQHLQSMDVPPRFVAQFEHSMEPLDRAIARGTSLGEGLEILTQLTVRIGNLSTEFPRPILQTLPEQSQQFQTTLKHVRDRRIGAAKSDVGELLGIQVELILQLLDWKPGSSGDGSSSPSQPGGGAPSMSELLRQQRRLSQGMMPMFGEGKVPSSLARQMLRQQQMIRRGMQELAQRQGQNEEILGDLQEITKDMKESEQQMEKRDFDQTLQARQKSILDRMEQATRSLSDGEQQRRPEQSKRVATPGDGDTAPFSRSDYQKILEKLKDPLNEQPPSEREAILRFYRFWFQPDSSQSAGDDIQ